jgi:hypothetical protein
VGESLIYTATSKQGAKKVSSSSAHRIGTKRPERGAISGGAISGASLSMGRTNEGRRYLINTHAPEITNHIGWLHLMF